MDLEDWKISSCTCPHWKKNYICKHVISNACRDKGLAWHPNAKDVPLGRPAETNKALNMQEIETIDNLFEYDDDDLLVVENDKDNMVINGDVENLVVEQPVEPILQEIFYNLPTKRDRGRQPKKRVEDQSINMNKRAKK
ncbi:hypothetical protein BpHYR1_004681 [Brachionus plicatilis]|uniref:SWIM-type domain-containing protein n=1 Tax=Brachionus plicatilis TaxID=10195 RepID=A0A3M7R2U8_BRAPC|nr:hypothetical protein BpHYR1_004681 [Brachionus plicatilis]